MPSTKTPTKSKQDSYSNDHAKVVKGFKSDPCYETNPQWINPGDFFVKFSIYDQTSSGSTSSETTLITIV